LKKIFYSLLKDQKEFGAFFRFLKYNDNNIDLEKVIRETFQSKICEQANLPALVSEHPIELAYSLALINTNRCTG
jgi:ATP-dependent DNA helicase RecQ